MFLRHSDISIAGKGTVLKATKGIAFGELALLHNAPRAATVTTESDVIVFFLDEVCCSSSSSVDLSPPYTSHPSPAPAHQMPLIASARPCSSHHAGSHHLCTHLLPNPLPVGEALCRSASR